MSSKTTRPKIIVTGDTKRPHVVKTINAFKRLATGRCDVVRVKVDQLSPARLRGKRMLVVFGGDGAILMAARRIAGVQIPVVGVNTGKLGFLAPFTLEQLDASLDGFLKRKVPTESRMMLYCTVTRKGKHIFKNLALNEAAITGGLPSRLHWIDVHVNGQPCICYRGDGIIIATPVGSTGYSLAAGGPLVVPGIEVMIVRPICPHTFAGRSLVIPSSTHLKLTVRPPVKGIGLTLDGQDWISLTSDDVITVKKAPHPLLVVPGENRTYFQTLKDKLYWGGHPNYGD